MSISIATAGGTAPGTSGPRRRLSSFPDRLQPRYGLKVVGYVEHRLEDDGTHASRLVEVADVPTLSIEDFPGAYGPV